MRPLVIAQRKLQHVLEKIRAHSLTVAMGEPVCVERDECAAQDNEQAEPDPGGDERQQVEPGHASPAGLRICEPVDNLAEQHWLDELRRCQSHARAGKNPTQACFWPEDCEHTDIET